MRSTSSTDTRATSEKELAFLARAFLAALGSLSILSLLGGRAPGEMALLPCPFRLLFGVPCPGCGMTRSCLSLARGDLAAAWSLHPLSPAFCALAVTAALAPGRLRRGWAGLRPRVRTVTASCALVAVLLMWALRLAGGWDAH